MRPTLFLVLLLAGCAAAPDIDPNIPGPDAEMSDVPEDDEPMIDPLLDARVGLLASALESSWTIVDGPWESVTFNEDGTVFFYANDRLMESGEWDVEEGDLFILPEAGGQTTYTIQERRIAGMTFTGADGPFVIERER